MNRPKWIWYYGDYEIFHSLQLHSRREEFGADYPPMWTLSNVYPITVFTKNVELDASTELTATVNGIGYVLIDYDRFPTGAPITCPKGKHLITVRVMNFRGLPAAFVEGDVIYSDESWTSSIAPGTEKPVGCTPAYYNKCDNVEIFPFEYQTIAPASREKTENGYLYDFGRETFAKLCFKTEADAVAVYGESREEALAYPVADKNHGAFYTEAAVKGADVTAKARAFRFIHIITESEPQNVHAQCEHLSLTDKASFECNDPMIKTIFDVCAYTFHLNSREFFLDGIKRDRWVWSGDAYQSFMVNRYLYADPEITKRTIIGLLGKPPYVQHINTINDYSFYLIIAAYDYWYDTGDTEFIKNIYDRLYGLYEFCVSRLDENGLVCKRDGDWIFVDWNDHLDKEGPMCAEQILLWQATKCIKKLADITGEAVPCAIDEVALKEKIYTLYYKRELGGFTDGYVSGKNRISRHQNVFALLYDFATENECRLIMEKILCNPEVPAITTPYFELYELIAMCKYGNVKYMTDMLTSYWGEMIKLGATSVWEQFDPTKKGAEHYEMYGRAFGCSLCHTWGSGPILLLGKYVAGVSITSVGGKTFKVEPNTVIYESFKATVPVNGGTVTVEYKNGRVTVLSTADGGTLVFNEKAYTIPVNKQLTI